MYWIDEDERKHVSQVITSKSYFRYQGPGVETKTSACEKQWCDFLNNDFSLLVTSGTNALVVGMASLGIGPGDEVIIPAYTFVATASAVMQVGAIPVIANIDESLTLDPKDLKRCLSDRTKAIMAVHMDGLICDLTSLQDFCDHHSILLLEDAAQSCGGEYQGHKVGTLGDMGAFSFNMDKVISCGEGGLLTLKKDKYELEKKRAFISHDTAAQYGQTMKEELEGVGPFFGISSRLNEINSAMLIEQINKLPIILEKLRERKKMWKEAFDSEGIEYLKGHDDKGDVATCIHIKCSDPMAAAILTKKLIAQGVKALPPHFKPAHACWQWMQGMSKKDYYVPGLNPYRLTDREYSYEKAQFLPTVMILGQCLKIVLNLDISLDEEQQLIDKVVAIIKN